MKKADLKRLDAALDKAISPPKRKPTQALDALLEEYDDGQAIRASEVAVPSSPSQPSKSQNKQQVNVVTPVATPAATPVTKPSSLLSPSRHTNQAFGNDDSQIQQPLQYLDATHTPSEQQIYSVMYRETISKNIQERHFGPRELCQKTGIRSDRTIRTALRGLRDKLSIEVLSHANGNPLGPRYRIFDVKEILKKRKMAEIVIDPQSKKIIAKDSTPAITGVATGVATPPKNYRGTPVDFTGVTPVDFTGVFKYINTLSSSGVPSTSSSSNSVGENADDDENFLAFVQEVYERATGNRWTTADVQTAQKFRDIPPAVWGIAICYCVDRAPNHKFERLAYVADEARNHQAELEAFSPADLEAILRHSLRKIEKAKTTGQWNLNSQQPELSSEGTS